MERVGCRDLIASGSLITFLSCFQAEAGLGFARLDWETYYLHSNSRPDNTVALVFGPDLESTGPHFDYKFELENYVYVNSPKSFTPESQNAYIATSRQASSLHQGTFGRRIYDWSVADDFWKLGTWSPRFNWDPLNPETVGNTGLFYSYESKSWRFLLFGSYINAPERGVPLNSNLTSPSGDWVSPFSQVNLPALNNAQIPIKYKIVYPPLGDLIFRPSAAFQARYGEKHGAWASVGYAYMPIHQADLLVEGILPAQSLEVDVSIHPVILMQHLVSVETGIKEENWSLWGSATREIPILQHEPATWIQQPMGPSNIFSVGTSAKIDDRLSLSASGLLIEEALPPVDPGNSLSLSLPSRFPYRKAIQVGLNLQANDRWNYQMRWIDDITNVSDLISFDVGYHPNPNPNPKPKPKGDWFIGLGTDVIFSAYKQGLIGQFNDNNRVRARVAYAF